MACNGNTPGAPWRYLVDTHVHNRVDRFASDVLSGVSDPSADVQSYSLHCT